MRKPWREEYLERKPGLTQYQIEILKEGPKSLSQAWALQSMMLDYKKKFLTHGTTH